ncbi:MAG TPA: cellulose biosynthesis protein BcsS [Hyphomicrobiaceae bacterium]|nr:cellulose biosynthesis protein BcsS [Hyphomicrobiaceae bacterium]
MVAPVRAEEPPTVEVSGGGEIGGHLWSAYTNTTVVLSGWLAGVPKSIREDGWRLRAGAGYWRMQGRFGSGFPTQSDPRPKYKKWGSTAELLLGYHATFGALTVKAYAGLEHVVLGSVHIDRSGTYDDLELQFGTGELGAKAIIESWYNLTPYVFAQLDMSWGSRVEAFGTRLRLGYRFSPGLAVGPEMSRHIADNAAIWGFQNYGFARVSDSRDSLTRYGGFVRYEWSAGEISASAGLTDDADDNGFYATLNALLRF